MRCAENDFAVFVFSPDDHVAIRGGQFDIARDNVLFESGLFMGMHGRERCFLIAPQSTPSFHLPTDYLGFTTATYDHVQTGPALGAATSEIRQALKNSSWSKRRLQIKSYSTYVPGAHWKLELFVQFRNNDSAAVVIESDGFEPATGIPIDPIEKSNSGERYQYKFMVGKEADGSGKDVYLSKTVIFLGQSATIWIPIDPAFGKDSLEKVPSRQAWILHYRLTWLERPPAFGNFEDEI